MSLDFDVIIVGSGPAGVSAAFPLLEAGLRVLMVDGGKQAQQLPPSEDFLSWRSNDASQAKWMLGKQFHALKMHDAVSPKLRVPSLAYTFDDFQLKNKIVGDNFIAVGSLATGGLSNAWGCGVARFSSTELATFPCPESDMEAAYGKVARRIGISGGSGDDLSQYFGLDAWSGPPIALDRSHGYLNDRYAKVRAKLNLDGFTLGRSRVAVLSEDREDRQACNRSGNCLWGCQRRALYSATDELAVLRRFANFQHQSGFVVQKITRVNDGWSVIEQPGNLQKHRVISARKILLAAGTLATTRFALQALNISAPVKLLSCPTAAFLLWLPNLLGSARTATFGLGQLSFNLKLQNGINGFGSTFATTGIPVSEFVRHLPLRRRVGVDVLQHLLSSCLVGNVFLPGHLSTATARLKADGSLTIEGGHNSDVMKLMAESATRLRKAYGRLRAVLLPMSFTIGRPGGDIHYAGTLPMRADPGPGETSASGQLFGLSGIYVIDGACLPTLSEKSHTLTIMANADRIARRLIDEVGADVSP